MAKSKDTPIPVTNKFDAMFNSDDPYGVHFKKPRPEFGYLIYGAYSFKSGMIDWPVRFFSTEAQADGFLVKMDKIIGDNYPRDFNMSDHIKLVNLLREYDPECIERGYNVPSYHKHKLGFNSQKKHESLRT